MVKPKVLLVDDEVSILKSLHRVFIKDDYEVFATSSPFEALHLASNNEFSVVIADERMPHLEGTALLEKFKEISPNSVRIILTGYADVQAAMNAINQSEVFRFLAKPWDDDELRQIVKEAIAQSERLNEQKRRLRDNHENKDISSQLLEKAMSHENRLLHSRLQQSYISCVEMIGKSMYLANPYMCKHSKRVARTCVQIGKRIGLPQDKLLQLETAALLRDVGQMGVGVAGDLLKKPLDTLTAQEREFIQNHPIWGFNLIEEIPNFLEAAYFIRHHHEHFDGSGYPDKLKGLGIPYGSRIIIVAEAYEKALKKAKTSSKQKKILPLLEEGSGKVFDPDVLNLLKQIIEDPNKSEPSSPVELSIYWQNQIQTFEKNCIQDKNYQTTSEETGHTELEFSDLPLRDTPLSTSESKNSSMIETSLGAIHDIPDVKSVAFQLSSDFSLSESMFPAEEVATQWLPDEDEIFPLVGADNFLLGSTPLLVTPEHSNSVKNLENTSSYTGTPDFTMEPEENGMSSENLADEVLAPSADGGIGPLLPLSMPIQDNMGRINSAYPADAYRNRSEKIYKSQSGKKLREVYVSYEHLAPGMVLSRDLITRRGIKLLHAHTMIQPNMVIRLRNFLSQDPPQDDRIYIYYSKNLSA